MIFTKYSYKLLEMEKEDRLDRTVHLERTTRSFFGFGKPVTSNFSVRGSGGSWSYFPSGYQCGYDLTMEVVRLVRREEFKSMPVKW